LQKKFHIPPISGTNLSASNRHPNTMTSHKKKSDREWEQKLSQFAITGKIGKGGAPQKTDTIYYTKYTNIRNCPMFRSGAGKQATLWSSSVAGCNCGYKHVEDAPVVAAAAPAAAAAAPKPAVTIPFKIPKKNGAKNINTRRQRSVLHYIQRGVFRFDIIRLY